MSSVNGFISDAASILIAALYTVAGQAHFTDQLTPGFAADLEVMTRNSYRALNVFDLQYEKFKQVLGAWNILAALCLWRPSTRRLGLFLAIIGFSSGLYAQWSTGQDVTQIGSLLALAVGGMMLRPS